MLRESNTPLRCLLICLFLGVLQLHLCEAGISITLSNTGNPIAQSTGTTINYAVSGTSSSTGSNGRDTSNPVFTLTLTTSTTRGTTAIETVTLGPSLSGSHFFGANRFPFAGSYAVNLVYGSQNKFISFSCEASIGTLQVPSSFSLLSGEFRVNITYPLVESPYFTNILTIYRAADGDVLNFNVQKLAEAYNEFSPTAINL